jgi:glutamate formiminotransferase
MDDCVRIARTVAEGLADRHGIPVFLYEAAATVPNRRRLESIRRGGLAGLSARMTAADWRPDFGPTHPHPSAGVSVVGARMPLIAFNITLTTNRLEAATMIARSVRESSGGLPCVKALGLPLAASGRAQVSMNLTDFRVTSLRTVYDTVRREARRLGVSLGESELVGLVPAEALSDADAVQMRIRGYDGTQVLERRRALRGAR